MVSISDLHVKYQREVKGVNMGGLAENCENGKNSRAFLTTILCSKKWKM